MSLYLRKAEESDARLLYRWVNDPAVRRNSFQSAPIAWEEHAAWFSRCLQDADTDMYILLADEEPVGQIRLRYEGDAATVSYSVAEAWRGGGYGRVLLLLAEQKLRAEQPDIQTLRGAVKAENLPSRKAFLACGYTQGEDPGGFVFEKRLCRVGVAFRVDANPTIATGHLRRCLSIAAALRAAGESCLFFTVEPEAVRLAMAEGYLAERLPGRYDEPDPAPLCARLAALGIKTLVVDGYFVTADYLRALGRVCRTVYLDDLDAFAYPVDMVVNYALGADKRGYGSRYGAGTRLLLGPAYAPLRAQFAGLAPQYRPTVRDVLLTTGGADACNAACRLGAALPETFRGHIVAGRMRGGMEALRKLVAQRDNILLHEDVRDMAGLMQSCDAALSAGGGTLYELCACGVPTVCFGVADNQMENLHAFARAGLMRYAGDLRADPAACTARAMEGLRAYAEDAALRQACGAAMRALVDGEGAARLARAIMEL